MACQNWAQGETQKNSARQREGINPSNNTATAFMHAHVRFARIVLGKLNRLRPSRLRFAGAYNNREVALSSIPAQKLAGYDHKQVAPICFEQMCQVALWDYPHIFWLKKLFPSSPRILDAGGHMGTKYRAFAPYLQLNDSVTWTIYDLPEIVGAGRDKAEADGLGSLKFVDDIEQLPGTDILLASGLLQYLDIPFPIFLSKIPVLPRHLLINKVALWERETTVTLENFGVALVPYQIRNREEFLASVCGLGYRTVDSWKIDALSHKIQTHVELGPWQSEGFYMELQG